MKMPNGYSEVQARTGAREQLPGRWVCVQNSRSEGGNKQRVLAACDRV